MTKLCPRGKAAAKRKFKVYPSAYANAYASKICAGKIKDPSGTKRKDFKGPKPASAKDGKFMNEIEKEGQKRKRILREQKTFERAKPNIKRRGKKNSSIARPKPKGYFKGGQTGLLGLDLLTSVAGMGALGLGLKALGRDKDKSRKEEESAYARGLKEGLAGSTVAEEKAKTGETTSMNMGGFSKMGNHDVMGSPVSVDVDGDNLMSQSAKDYYKDLL